MRLKVCTTCSWLQERGKDIHWTWRL